MNYEIRNKITKILFDYFRNVNEKIGKCWELYSAQEICKTIHFSDYEKVAIAFYVSTEYYPKSLTELKDIFDSMNVNFTLHKPKGYYFGLWIIIYE